MKLLLRKTINKLGIVGDIIEVADGYGRNYLLPQGLATAPTEANVRALAEARKHAEAERAAARARLEEAAGKIEGVEITIKAKANSEGVLYGSVSKRDIAEALNAEGHEVDADHVVLKESIRRLDTVPVDVRLAEDLLATVKVWVVRETGETEGEKAEGETEAPHAEADEGTEATADGEDDDRGGNA